MLQIRNRLPAVMIRDRFIIYQLLLPFLFILQSTILNLQSAILYAYPNGWSDDILLTPEDTEERGLPDVDVDRYNNVWAVWDSATWINGTAEILYSKRDSLGNSLISETDVSNNASYSIIPRIAVDASNNVHFIWRDESPQGLGIWHAKLANSGSVIVASHLAVSGAGGLALAHEIALNKYQEVNIAWEECPSGYDQISYTKLDSLGNPLVPKIQITPVNISACWPGIGVDSLANNHLGYRTDSAGTSDRLTYSKLDKDGNILISNKILGIGLGPTLINDKNQNIHIVYDEHTTYHNAICYLKLDNNGNILVGPKAISLPQINSNLYSHMAMDSLQYLHVVWQADSNTDVHIMYAKLDTNGNFVIPPMKIVYPYQSGEPRIAVDRSNRLHVVWIDGRLNSGGDIFCKRGENEMTVKEITRSKAVNFPKISVFPNPFTKETKIVFSFSRMVPSAAREENEKTQVGVYDILGRKVKEFMVEGSDGVIQWRGADSNGNRLPAGVYLLRITSAPGTQTVPVVLLR